MNFDFLKVNMSYYCSILLNVSYTYEQPLNFEISLW